MHRMTKFGFSACLYRMHVGVISLQEGVRHGALVFIRIRVINLHERIRHGATVFSTYIYLHIGRYIGYISWII